MVELPVCKHFNFGKKCFAVKDPFQKHLVFRGWVICIDKRNPRHATVRPFNYYYYINHLLEREECRDEIGINKEKIKEEKEELDRLRKK